jgi:hypothetical protein
MGKSRSNGIRRGNIIFAIGEKNETVLNNVVGIFSRVINEETLENPTDVGRLVKDKDKWRFYPKPDFTYQLETLSIICDTLRFLETGKLKVTKNGFESDSLIFIDEDEEEEGLSV